MKSALGAPGFLSAKTTMGSDISLLFAVGFISMFLYAGFLARSGKGQSHHRIILASMTAMALYIAYYIQVRYLGVASAMDQMSFGGPAWVHDRILKPLLIGHVTIVCLTLYLSIYMLINGFRAQFPMGDRTLSLRTGDMEPSWALWGAGLAWLGLVLWAISGRPGLSMGHKAMILGLGFFAPAAVAIIIHKALPKADRRHRVMGRICLFLFSLMLVTTICSYFLIYIARY